MSEDNRLFKNPESGLNNFAAKADDKADHDESWKEGSDHEEEEYEENLDEESEPSGQPEEEGSATPDHEESEEV